MSEKAFQIALIQILKSKSNGECNNIDELSANVPDLTVDEKIRLNLLFKKQRAGITFFINLISGKREKKVKKILYLTASVIPNDKWLKDWQSYCTNWPLECSIDPIQDALNFGNLLLSSTNPGINASFEKDIIKYEIKRIDFMAATKTTMIIKNINNLPGFNSVTGHPFLIMPYLIYHSNFNIADFIMKTKNKHVPTITKKNCSLIVFQNFNSQKVETAEISFSLTKLLENYLPSTTQINATPSKINFNNIDENTKQKFTAMLNFLHKKGIVYFNKTAQ